MKQTNTEREIAGCLSQLETLYKRKALETVTSALGDDTVRLKRRGVRASTSTKAVDEEALVSFVKKNPGSNSESITAALGTTAIGMRRTVQKLLSEGVLRTKGQRRGTRYFAR